MTAPRLPIVSANGWRGNSIVWRQEVRRLLSEHPDCLDLWREVALTVRDASLLTPALAGAVPLGGRAYDDLWLDVRHVVLGAARRRVQATATVHWLGCLVYFVRRKRAAWRRIATCLRSPGAGLLPAGAWELASVVGRLVPHVWDPPPDDPTTVWQPMGLLSAKSKARVMETLRQALAPPPPTTSEGRCKERISLPMNLEIVSPL